MRFDWEYSLVISHAIIIVGSFSHKSIRLAWIQGDTADARCRIAIPVLISRSCTNITLDKLHNARHAVIVLEGIDDAPLCLYYITCSTLRDSLMSSPPARHIHLLRPNVDEILPCAL